MDQGLAERIGTALRSARVAKGLTQNEAAEMLGISLEFLGRIERGRTLPSVDTLARLVGKLGMSFDAVAQGRVTKAKARPAADQLVRRVERLLPRLSLRAVRAMSELASELVARQPR